MSKNHAGKRTSLHNASLEKKVEALEAFIERKERLKKTAPLRYLFWEATLRCNLACRHCGSDCVRDDSTRDREIPGAMIKGELKSIAARYPPRDCTFAIIGGEPLVRDDVIDVGAYAAGLGYNWGITTNGMLLSRSTIARLKNADLKTISVSLDGIETDHDRLRNCPGSFKIVTAAIRDLLEDPFFVKFDVICCVSRINVDRLEAFMEELVRLRIPAARFTPVFSRGRAGLNSDLALDRSGYLKLLRFIAKQRAAGTSVRVSLSEEGYWGPQWECVVRDQFHYCGSGILIGSILHDGGVTGCPSVSRSFLEGRIQESPFVDIWKNRFTRYREDRRKTFGGKCGTCGHWVLCEGGGFHLLDQNDKRTHFCCLDKIGWKGEPDGT
jgi:radical SAM protein with 4Fe4S-binding SPASM domain